MDSCLSSSDAQVVSGSEDGRISFGRWGEGRESRKNRSDIQVNFWDIMRVCCGTAVHAA